MNASFQEKVRKSVLHREGTSPSVPVSCSIWDTMQMDQNLLYDCMDCDYNSSLIHEHRIAQGVRKGDELL